jgi:hypothetical protein
VPTGEGTTYGLWWTAGHLGVLTVLDARSGVPGEVVVAIDDRDSAVAAGDHAASWRRWLQMANAFAGAGHPVTLVGSTSTDVQHIESSVPADVRRLEALEQVAPEWASVLMQVEPGDAGALGAALAQAGVSAPLYGAEVADGIPVDFLWPDDRIVVTFDLDDETGKDLTDDGWRVVEPNVDAVVAALSAREGAR